ncbi:hypothetical protein G9A89_009206 [Geosiphon pyriformis]|nr:hypothetical protein G9A89_009206 [Geosiphon pyriformis]
MSLLYPESISTDRSSNYTSSNVENDDVTRVLENEISQMSQWNEKRTQALEQIDTAKFGLFHLRACLVSGVGFFTDAYDLFSINLVTEMLGYVYEAKNGYQVSENVNLGLKISAGFGTLVGQVVFGILADRVGRKKMYGLELWIIILATLFSALSAQAPSFSVYNLIIFWRFILGLGVGGDYPLSAIITSEFASAKNRGSMMATVFAMQGFGILTSIVIAMVTLLAAKQGIRDDTLKIDYVWRIVLGLGALPGILALYFRLTIPETPRYRMDVERDLNGATNDIEDVLANGKTTRENLSYPFQKLDVPRGSWADFRRYFGQWKNGKILLGTCGAWFCIDVAFYGIGLNNTIFLHELNFNLPGDNPVTNSTLSGEYNSAKDPWALLWNLSVGNALITVLGTVPGAWFTIFFIDRLGRKPIQFMGFAVLTIVFLLLGVFFEKIQQKSSFLFGSMFTIAQFFCNFGPNTTTFIVPGEVFPTRYRSTGHGISAAIGKLGAILAQFGFSRMKSIGGTQLDHKGPFNENNAFVDKLLLMCAAFMVLGFGFTFLIPETKGKSLEELSNEDQREFVRNPGKGVLANQNEMSNSRQANLNEIQDLTTIKTETKDGSLIKSGPFDIINIKSESGEDEDIDSLLPICSSSSSLSLRHEKKKRKCSTTKSYQSTTSPTVLTNVSASSRPRKFDQSYSNLDDRLSNGWMSTFRWTKEEEKVILDNWIERGIDYPEISRQLPNRATRSIQRKFKKMAASVYNHFAMH